MSGGDSDQQIRIIDAAVAAGVKRFVPDEFSHDSMNEHIQGRIPKYAGRAKVIAHLQKISKDHPDFEWTAIATGYTLDTQLISGNMGFDMEWHSATIHGTGTEPFSASSLERVGQIVVRTIQHWDEIKNQYIYAAGMITSANEVLRSAEKATETTTSKSVSLKVRRGLRRGTPILECFCLNEVCCTTRHWKPRDLSKTGAQTV
jgi:hypothetical protein